MTITPRWPSTPLPKYPHLVGSDIPIWDSWVRQHGSYFEGFDYDVHVGQGLEPEKDQGFQMRQMWISLTRKRVDVVGYRPGEVWLIEVKDRPTTAAIGQVLSYKVLYDLDYGWRFPTVPCLIAGSIEPDIEAVLTRFDIRFWDLSDDHHWLVDLQGRPIQPLE